jgi:hypothetical protein
MKTFKPMTCSHCEGAFVSKAAHGRFCSVNCRVAAHRAKHGPERHAAKIARLRTELRRLRLGQGGGK